MKKIEKGWLIMFSKIKALKNITKLALIGGLFLTMTSYAAPKYVETDIVENKITAALFSVSLDPNGGTINNSTDSYRVVSNDTDKKVSFPTASKDHYDFKGYALSESDPATYDTPENGKLTGSIQQYNLPIKDDKGNSLNGTTLKAIFKPHAYNIKYILDTGKWRNEEQTGKTTYTCEDEAYTIPQPTKEGYTFTGWTSSNGSTPQTSFTIPKGSTGDISLTANWKPNGYTYFEAGKVWNTNQPNNYMPFAIRGNATGFIGDYDGVTNLAEHDAAVGASSDRDKCSYDANTGLYVYLSYDAFSNHYGSAEMWSSAILPIDYQVINASRMAKTIKNNVPVYVWYESPTQRHKKEYGTLNVDVKSITCEVTLDDNTTRSVTVKYFEYVHKNSSGEDVHYITTWEDSRGQNSDGYYLYNYDRSSLSPSYLDFSVLAADAAHNPLKATIKKVVLK